MHFTVLFWQRPVTASQTIEFCAATCGACASRHSSSTDRDQLSVEPTCRIFYAQLTQLVGCDAVLAIGMCQVVSDDQRLTHNSSIATKSEQAHCSAPEENASTSDRSTVQCGLSRRSKSDGELRPPGDQRVTSAQLAQHNTEDDCWMAIKGKVNDRQTIIVSRACRSRQVCLF